MGPFERAIALFAPGFAAHRAEARERASRAELREEQMRRVKRFLSDDRHGPDWTRNTGKVADALPRLTLERRRIRRLVATNPYAAKAMNALVNNLVGYGIFGTPEKRAPEKVRTAWANWVKRCDWLGQLDLWGLQDLAVRTMLGDGDTFIVRRFDKAARDPGTRLQVLDVDMLAEWLGDGGIEYDENSRPTFYHFLKARPGQNSTGGRIALGTVKIPAADVIHLFRHEWPGQARGRSIFEPIVQFLEDAGEYLGAEVVRKKIEACFVGFVKSDPEAAAPRDLGNIDGGTSTNDFPIETFEPGMIERLDPGEEIQFGEPKATVGLKDFFHVIMQGSGAGAQVTYEMITGDLSNVNYSSYRAGHLEFQRFCRRLQWLLIVPRFLDRAWAWFLEDGYQLGLFARDDYSMRWVPPKFESIDPEKSAKGDVAEMRAGLESRRAKLAERGEDHDEKMKEIAEDLRLQQGLGLAFEGDPFVPIRSEEEDDDEDDDANA